MTLHIKPKLKTIYIVFPLSFRLLYFRCAYSLSWAPKYQTLVLSFFMQDNVRKAAGWLILHDNDGHCQWVWSPHFCLCTLSAGALGVVLHLQTLRHVPSQDITELKNSDNGLTVRRPIMSCAICVLFNYIFLLISTCIRYIVPNNKSNKIN